MREPRRKRRMPAILVIAVVFVLFAWLMAWTIDGAREFGFL